MSFQEETCEDAQSPISQGILKEPAHSSETEVKLSDNVFSFLSAQNSITIQYNVWKKMVTIYNVCYKKFYYFITYTFPQIAELQASAHDNGHEITVAQ